MPSTKTEPVTKAKSIRNALAQYPDKGPTEIARILSKRLGVPFRAKHISVIKSKSRDRQTPRPQAAPAAARQTAEAPSETRVRKRGVAEIVTTLQSYIERLGKEDLHRLIDAL